MGGGIFRTVGKRAAWTVFGLVVLLVAAYALMPFGVGRVSRSSGTAVAVTDACSPAPFSVRDEQRVGAFDSQVFEPSSCAKEASRRLQYAASVLVLAVVGVVGFLLIWKPGREGASTEPPEGDIVANADS